MAGRVPPRTDRFSAGRNGLQQVSALSPGLSPNQFAFPVAASHRSHRSCGTRPTMSRIRPRRSGSAAGSRERSIGRRRSAARPRTTHIPQRHEAKHSAVTQLGMPARATRAGSSGRSWSLLRPRAPRPRLGRTRSSATCIQARSDGSDAATAPFLGVTLPTGLRIAMAGGRYCSWK